GTVAEASAVTYDSDTGTLFVVGDKGHAVVEFSKDGVQLNIMTLAGFDDTEGLTYIGNNRFVIVEERLQDVFQFEFSAGGTVHRDSLPTVSLGGDAGNDGLEGISYDRRDGSFVVVKEKNLQQVRLGTIDFGARMASVPDLFTPDLHVDDLADVQVLATVP